MSNTEEVATTVLEHMGSVNALLAMLSDTKKYKAAHDVLQKRVEEIRGHHKSVHEKLQAMEAAKTEAAQLKQEHTVLSAKNDEATEKLASWEAELRLREKRLELGSQELSKNTSARDTELRQRQEALDAREKALKAEENRIEQVRKQTVASLST